ncbi:MAG TPA: hypothetical protein VM938_04195 [Acidimicrobiales bacterium]|nr:hypothetical protein [Acidimicrobiales bacterium]
MSGGDKEAPLAPVPDDERERRVAELGDELRPAEERERLADDEQS